MSKSSSRRNGSRNGKKGGSPENPVLEPNCNTTNSSPSSESNPWADFEDGSESLVKSKRGRPRSTPPEWDQLASGMLCDKSRKTVVKHWAALPALSALMESGQPDFSRVHGKNGTHWELLAELGRLGDADRIRTAAMAICDSQMNVREAVHWVRRLRNCKASPSDPGALAKEIARAIRDYKLRHPDTSPEQILTALGNVGLDYAPDPVADSNADGLSGANAGNESESR